MFRCKKRHLHAIAHEFTYVVLGHRNGSDNNEEKANELAEKWGFGYES